MPSKVPEYLIQDFYATLILIGALAVLVLVVTARHKPWRKKYGPAAWDFNQSFALNLGTLAAAINGLLTAATATSSDLKTGTALATATYAIFTACAPLAAAAWKTPDNLTYFGGVVSGVLVTAFGVIGQLRTLMRVALEESSKEFGIAAAFAAAMVFLYCLATADRLAKTPPTKVVQVSALAQPTEVLAKWALP